MQRFTDLKVWQRSHGLVLALYSLTRGFPAEERYGLAGQLRRAAASVPTNLAEGSKRRKRQDFARFVNIAEGSMAEVEYLLMLVRDLGYANAETIKPHLQEADEIGRMLYVFRKRLEDGDDEG